MWKSIFSNWNQSSSYIINDNNQTTKQFQFMVSVYNGNRGKHECTYWLLLKKIVMFENSWIKLPWNWLGFPFCHEHLR